MSRVPSWRTVHKLEAGYLRELLERAPADVMASPEHLATWLAGCGVHVGMAEYFHLLPPTKPKRRRSWWKFW